MDCTGKIVSVNRDWQTNKLNITFQIDEEPTNEINRLGLCEKLNIEVKKYRQKRSLDANATLWLCLGRMADAWETPIDKWEIYLQMLKRYGKYTYICVSPEAVEAVKEQWRECEVVGEGEINGKPTIQMLCYFGSSTYNTKEFSKLLDGVISEMKEMELDTPTSEEMKRALELWEQQKNGKI